jgi:hypothetical protein
MAELDALVIKIQADVKNAEAGLTAVQKQLANTAVAGAKAGAAVAKTGKDFTGLSRVIQDLPYGFNGISNNLTQLLPAAGAAGLAISAITTAITFATVGFGAWTRGIGQTKEEIDALGKSLAGAFTEVTTVSSLLSVAKDLTQTTQTRTNALEQAKKLYPGYIEFLNLENVNSQEAANAIDMLSFALERKAKVQAISNLLIEAESLLYTKQRGAISENILSVKSFLGLFKSGVVSTGFGVGGILGGATDQAIDDLQSVNNQIKDLKKQLLELTQQQSQAGDFKLLNPTKEVLKKAKEEIEKGPKANKFNLSWQIVDVDGTAAHFATDINRALDKSAEGITPGITTSGGEAGTKWAQSFSEALTETLNQGLRNAFEAVGEAIGKGGNPLAAVFTVMGDTLIAFGKQIIGTVTLISTLSKAFSAALKGNAVLGIIAGVGLIAIGNFLKNAIEVPKFATGGIVTKPTLALIGEQGPEQITPLGYSNNSRNNNVMSGEVIFQISGQVLRGILRRENQVAYNTF